MKKAVREGGLSLRLRHSPGRSEDALIITRRDETPSSANAMDGCGTIMHACWNDAVEILPRLQSVPRDRRGLARTFELCHAHGASPRERAIGPNVTELKMTREGVCKAFGLSPSSSRRSNRARCCGRARTALSSSPTSPRRCSATASSGRGRRTRSSRRWRRRSTTRFPPCSACRRSPTTRRSRRAARACHGRALDLLNAFAGLMARATAALQARSDAAARAEAVRASWMVRRERPACYARGGWGLPSEDSR